MKNYKTIQEVRDCDELTDIEKVQIEFHAENFYGLKLALESYKEVEVYEGSAIGYARRLFDESYTFSDSVAPYIDYEAFANDLLLEEIYQFNNTYLIIHVSDLY